MGHLLSTSGTQSAGTARKTTKASKSEGRPRLTDVRDVALIPAKTADAQAANVAQIKPPMQSTRPTVATTSAQEARRRRSAAERSALALCSIT